MHTILLDARGVEQTIAKMADAITQSNASAPFAVVGIRRGGVLLAHRLATKIESITGQKPPLGFVDITLYRDDGFGPHDWPVVGTNDIGFDVRRHTVILVDDVLYTGRTVRAALDAILDFGRPKGVRLAVLIDRGLRELPIAADFAGLHATTEPNQHVSVRLSEDDTSQDMAFVEELQKRDSTERENP